MGNCIDRNVGTQVALTGVVRGSEDQALMQAVRETARAATDFGWLTSGDSVLIKPALNSGNPYPATTSPESIGAMVELLKEMGAGRVIVSDMSGIEHVKLTPERLKGSSRELMHASGMAQAALEAGAELYFPEEAGWDAFFEDHPVDATYWKKGIMMPNILQEVDHIVLMPRCSRHLLLGSSLGMKCAVGYWRTDSRLEYHKNASTIQEMTADANTVKCLRDKQRLVLTTATQIITTKGPDDGFVAKPETGLVIASESIVAHDMVSLAWLLHNRRAMSEKESAGSRDPYKSQAIVGNLNRLVVMRLGGLGEAVHAEKLVRNDIGSIWDDRVLNRAYEVLGGIPEVDLVDVGESVPQEVRIALANHLEKSWWALLVRGLATVLFGVIALAQPPVMTLVLTFVVFSLVDGIAGVISSILSRKEGDHWWSAVLRGLVGVAPGVLALVQPQLGPLRLLYVIAARALVTGILDVIRAIRLRKEIEGEVLLILGGLASVLFGLIAFVRPGAGALAVISLIAIYALFVGLILMLLAFRMRGWGKKPEKLGAI